MSNFHLSEVFPLAYSKLNIASFRLSSEVDKKIGNSFGWHFSKQFPGVVVIWEKGYFWILAISNSTIPSKNEWRQALESIQEKQRDKYKLGDRFYHIQWVNQPQINACIIAELAIRILKINCRFTTETIFNENQVQVKRECGFWSEVYEINNKKEPAITLTSKSAFLYKETLEHFFENHPYRNDPEKLLVNLLVRDIDNMNTATIVEINGTMKEHRDRLLQQATGSTSKEQLKIAPDEQPVVSVKFNKSYDESYDYAMAALRPCVTSQTASKFDIEIGTLLSHTKIDYKKEIKDKKEIMGRQESLYQYKQEAAKILINYGIQFQGRCISSRHKPYSHLFWIPETELKDTLLLFGNGITSPKHKTCRGLSQGGVYRRHEEFDPKGLNRSIRLGILNFSGIKVQRFFNQLKQQLAEYKFLLSFENKPEFIKSESLEGLSETEAKVKVVTLVNELIKVPKDIVLVFLPESDRGKDDSDGNSIYAWIYGHLLRRKIASQVIYEHSLKQKSNYKNILNNVVPGILAKLGNIPFVLAKPLPIADYFIGLDISRKRKKNKTGSINACACVRLYGKRGEFIKYQIADNSQIEGEEIPAKTLQSFLPLQYFQNKTVLIYRDGLFRGDEIKNILAWGKAINCKFILVECAKSQIPRLYNLSDKNIQQPTRGLALQLSSNEVILVTTQIPKNIGVPRPLRLKVRDGNEEGLSVDLKALVDTTLKLTLLHYGSLKDPRLPIPLFGADKIAYRRLQGIYPGELEGDKQYWL